MPNNLASFKLRLLAYLNEFFIFSLIGNLFLLYLADSKSLPELFYKFMLYLTLFVLPWMFVAALFYSPYFTSRFGGNIGKLITGLEVVDQNSKRLSFRRSFFRNSVGYSFSALFFGLGFLAVIKNPNKQAWHDEAVGSFVKVNKPSALGIIVFICLLIINSFILVQAFNKVKLNFGKTLGQEFLLLKDSFKKSPQMESSDSAKVSDVNQQVSSNYQVSYQEISNLINQRNYASAKLKTDALLAIAKTDGEKSLGYLLLGEIAYQQRDDAQARKDLFEAKRLSPDVAAVYQILAQIEIEAKNDSLALEYAKKAVELAPEQAIHHNNLGVALYNLGKVSEGIAEVKKAVQIDPNTKLYQDNLTQMQGGQ